MRGRQDEEELKTVIAGGAIRAVHEIIHPTLHASVVAVEK
jgi:hypothetical protein